MNALLQPAVTIEAFENATVDGEAFDHEAHVYTAWLYLQEWPLNEATQRFCGASRRLTIKLGAKTKYHETVTCFFMQLINQRRMAATQSTWLEFRRENTDLISGAGGTLSRYYSTDLLASDLARQHYLLPDKLDCADA